MRIFAILVALALGSAATAAAQDQPGMGKNDFCEKTFDCDCSTVGGGLLARE